MSLQNELITLCESMYQITGIHVCIYDNVRVITERLTIKEQSIVGHYEDFCKSVRTLWNQHGNCHALCSNCDRVDAQKYARDTRRPFVHRCYIGLTEYIIPLFSGDDFIGIAFLGQCAVTDRDNLSDILDHIERYGGNREHFEKLYQEMTKVTISKLMHAGNVLELALKHILESCHTIQTAAAQNSVDSLSSLAVAYIRTRHRYPIQVKDIAAELHISVSHLSRIFSKEYQCSILDYLNEQRLETAKELLRSSFLPVSMVAESSGFSDPNYFSRYFKKKLGITPKEFRHQTMKASPTSTSDVYVEPQNTPDDLPWKDYFPHKNKNDTAVKK